MLPSSQRRIRERKERLGRRGGDEIRTHPEGLLPSKTTTAAPLGTEASVGGRRAVMGGGHDPDSSATSGGEACELEGVRQTVNDLARELGFEPGPLSAPSSRVVPGLSTTVTGYPQCDPHPPRGMPFQTFRGGPPMLVQPPPHAYSVHTRPLQPIHSGIHTPHPAFAMHHPMTSGGVEGGQPEVPEVPAGATTEATPTMMPVQPGSAMEEGGKALRTSTLKDQNHRILSADCIQALHDTGMGPQIDPHTATVLGMGLEQGVELSGITRGLTLVGGTSPIGSPLRDWRPNPPVIGHQLDTTTELKLLAASGG